MADSTFQFALPIPTASQTTISSRRKRKRSLAKPLQEKEDDNHDLNTEYSAIVSPEERAQRRLAGQPLDRLPPSAPFPHGVPSEPSIGHDHDSTFEADRILPLHVGHARSLRNQHLAVMTAILHKSLEERDHARASNVLAAILRTDVLGHPVDMRHADLWLIAAEILLRSDPSASTGPHNSHLPGIEKAKLLYDYLARQHPWHRSWPNAVNALDFKIAKFSLWIYAISTGGRKLHKQMSDQDVDGSWSSLPPDLQVKRWELSQAQAVSKEMDILMGTLPYMDHNECIRLRAMVALWTADLLELVDIMEVQANDEDDFQDQNPVGSWTSGSAVQESSVYKRFSDAAEAERNLAESLLNKLH